LLLQCGFQEFVQRRAPLAGFALRLAQTWASLPVLQTVSAGSGVKTRGQSFYESGLNHALVSPDRFEALLNDVLTTAQKENQQAGKGIPMPPSIPVSSMPITLPDSDVSKPWYFSKGVIGSLVAIAIPIVSLWFPPAKIANPVDVTDWIMKIIQIVGPALGGAVALTGRLQARQPISGTAAAKAAEQQTASPGAAGGLDLLSLPFIQVVEQLPTIIAGLQQLHAATGALGNDFGVASALGKPLANLAAEAEGDRAEAGLVNGQSPG
jgi:hypothetical protein